MRKLIALWIIAGMLALGCGGKNVSNTSGTSQGKGGPIPANDKGGKGD